MCIYGQSITEHDNGKQNFPYSLEGSKDHFMLPISSGLMTAGIVGNALHKPMTDIEILSLNSNSLLNIDFNATQNWSPRLNTIRETLEPASFVAGLALIGVIGGQHLVAEENIKPLVTLMTMYSEGTFLSIGMVLLSKAVISRPRPFTYNSDLTLDFRTRASNNNESLISGNATVLFYNATFISQMLTDIYPESSWLPYVWIGSHSLAALSGYWSVKSGMHFPTDIIAGAVWGSSMAILVTQLHKKEHNRIKVYPWASNTGYGASLLLCL